MVPQCPQGAVGSGERWAPRVGSEAAPDWVVLEAVGLAAGTEVCIGRGFHGCHAGIIRIQVGIIHFVHRGSWKEKLQGKVCGGCWAPLPKGTCPVTGQCTELPLIDCLLDGHNDKEVLCFT